MLLFAVTALEKAEKVPITFWFKVVGAIIAFAIVLVILRKLAGMNKIILTIVGASICALIGFNWIYERNEPEFLTPIVDKLAMFFPTKGAYGNKQAEDVSKGVKKPAPSPTAPKSH